MLSLAEKQEHLPQIAPSNNTAVALYAKHFSLRQHPFAQLQDRNFYCAHQSAQEVVNTLHYCLRTGESLVKITGQPGVGKTYLIKNFIASLNEEYYVIPLLNPHVTPKELIQTIIDGLGIDYRSNMNVQQMTQLLFNVLCGFYALNKVKVVLCIDDAHKLSFPVLETLSVIDNLETHKRKLVQVVLFGDTALDEKLAHSRLTNFRLRIGFSETLKPLSRAETRTYIVQRLTVAGSHQPDIFSSKALASLYRHSDGVPRRLNSLCHKSLMLAFGEGAREITEKHVNLAAKDSKIKNCSKEQVAMLAFLLPTVLALLGGLLMLYVELVRT